jgi:hypothetical protein
MRSATPQQRRKWKLPQTNKIFELHNYRGRSTKTMYFVCKLISHKQKGVFLALGLRFSSWHLIGKRIRPKNLVVLTRKNQARNNAQVSASLGQTSAAPHSFRQNSPLRFIFIFPFKPEGQKSLIEKSTGPQLHCSLLFWFSTSH